MWSYTVGMVYQSGTLVHMAIRSYLNNNGYRGSRGKNYRFEQTTVPERLSVYPENLCGGRSTGEAKTATTYFQDRFLTDSRWESIP